MATYICPNGHEVTENAEGVICQECQIIATSYNTKTGDVHTWASLGRHRHNCEKLQQAMDDAFENQYFSGGW